MSLITKITEKLWGMTATLLVLSVILAPTTSAQSTFNEGAAHLYPWFDYRDDGSFLANYSPDNCSVASNLVGGDHQEKAFNFFIGEGRGLSAPQSAGIVGNLMVESYDEINPTAEYPGSARPYGIAQWTDNGGRRDRMLTWVNSALKDRGIDTGDDPYTYFSEASAPSSDELEIYFEVQLEFIWYEMTQGDETLALTELQKTNSAIEAATAFEKYYERANGQKLEDRIANAVGILNKYGSNYGGDVSSDSRICGQAGSGEIVGDWSLPLRRALFDQNQYWFNKPHHNKNEAVDLEASPGEEVYSMTSGTIINAGTGTTDLCGLGVVVQSPDGTQFIYCHGLDGGSVDGARINDTVKAGQLIMHNGSTGNYPLDHPDPDLRGKPSSSGPHLHLAIQTPDGARRCPQKLLESIYNKAPISPESLATSGCTKG
ncbi:MAG: phage tail tip lysozyme [Patescibacteria group bacterium]